MGHVSGHLPVSSVDIKNKRIGVHLPVGPKALGSVLSTKKEKKGGGVVTNNPKLVDYKINVKFLASSNFKN